MRTFTVQQAQELTPLLRNEVKELQAIYAELRERWYQFASQQGMTVDDVRLRDLCLQDSKVSALADKLEKSLVYLKELGVECKGIDEGLIDFPCLLEDRIVYLCWQVDEPRISHWHELDTGFVGRRPLLEATRVGAIERFVN